MPTEWWNELVLASDGIWKLGFSEPSYRAIEKLNYAKNPPDFRPLQEFLRHLRSEGIPADAKKIHASVPLFKIKAGFYQMTVRIYEDERRISVERLKLVDPSPSS